MRSILVLALALAPSLVFSQVSVDEAKARLEAKEKERLAESAKDRAELDKLRRENVSHKAEIARLLKEVVRLEKRVTELMEEIAKKDKPDKPLPGVARKGQRRNDAMAAMEADGWKMRYEHPPQSSNQFRGRQSWFKVVGEFNEWIDVVYSADGVVESVTSSRAAR